MGKRSFDFTRKENRLATGDLDFCPSTYSAVFFGGWLKQGRFGTKEFLIKKTKLGMFLGTPSFLPKNNLDHGAERRQSRPFASFVQAFLVVG